MRKRVEDVTHEVIEAALKRLDRGGSFLATGSGTDWQELSNDDTHEETIEKAKARGLVSPCGRYWANRPQTFAAWRKMARQSRKRK